ncbi:Signal transduction histidine kinase [Cnuella takakiae]|uniref:histidine kinase n=1 Tax=Cnuella takakiae TaxID=1302690 RepID=A0A1M5BWH9_9BACT|nr:response regulator [Cnuella takakiae]OLY93533.1 histidine kinase [Cnuella takakiae]SHF46582.1 Signal transduction histidine kinase [Cnuella takakiae]
MNQTFKRNLILGFGLSLLLLLISAIASFVSIRSLVKSAYWVNHTNSVIINLEQLFSNIKDAETGQRGYLLTRDPSFLTPYNGTEKKIIANLSELQDLTSDNPRQQVTIKTLRQAVRMRLDRLQKRIDELNNLGTVNLSNLAEGQQQMNRVRSLIEEMNAEEQRLLKLRTEDSEKFTQSTLLLIIVASILSLAVAIGFFLRVLADYNRRVALQQELEKKDREIHQRLTIISGIAEQISEGNYSVRVGDAEGQDVLGSLSGSLNAMARSLDDSFSRLSQNEWLQTGVAGLNDAMIGDKTMQALCHSILTQVASYSESNRGAFYLAQEDGSLKLTCGYALPHGLDGRILRPHEGLAGECAAQRKILYIENKDATDYAISISGAQLPPRSVVAIPIQFEGKLKGVIELASLQHFEPKTHHLFFAAIASNTGISLNAAKSRQRVQELLEETQAQAEELQAQHSELENINAELEAQAEKLQASEEELRVQQEELQQANSELEERSRLLEERNNLIMERNLEIQAKAEELAQSTRYKSEFLANMSHELRTPLNSILLLSRLLSENHEGNLSTDQVEYARVIQGSGSGLLTLIDEILDLSKIESGKMELEYQDVALAEIEKDLRNLFAPLAKEKGIAFDIKTEEGVTGRLETDKLRIEQILRNLISNALKFTSKGSVRLNISNQDDNLHFAVQDTGIGIPVEKQHTIFEAFQQADGSTRRKYGGTGLGLSISRELARLLGGEITLQSEEGKGSIFTLVVPKQKTTVAPAEMPEPVMATAPRIATAQATQPATPAFTAEQIPASIPDDRASIGPNDRVLLIVEDDTGFARSLLDYARRKNYKGIVAVRGDEGIELAQRYRPSGILLDVQLPVKSGWEVMEALKGNPATRPIPVHMMSAMQVKHKSLTAGAIDFIDKPVAFEQLSSMFQKIEEALSKHPRKVLIVEENTRHAQALAYFLENYSVQSQIRNSVDEGIKALNGNEADCVILDMGVPGQHAYKTLEEVKRTPGLEHIPIIIFTGPNLSHQEEGRIKQYADSIVIKTAHSYQRILDEVSLFLHLVEEQKTDQGSRRKALMPAEVLQGKTVLIADDDVRNIFSLTKILEQNGIQVLSAMDGKDALAQLQSTPDVDLVLLDMMMPEMDGYETARAIRANQRWRNLPIIAVTAKAMTGDREKCIEAGASDYITKPVDVDQLVSLLRVWLYQ